MLASGLGCILPKSPSNPNLIVRTGIVLNAVDTLFVCFVVDCNTPNESRLSYQEEVHAAFVHKVPKIK